MINEAIIEREAAANPEPQALIEILCDTSGSMGGAPIAALNNALPMLKQNFEGDALAAKRAKIALSAFAPNGKANGLVCDFVSPRDFAPPRLIATGLTPLGAAVQMSLDRLRARRQALADHGLRHYRPALYILSDGDPTDDYEPAAAAAKAADQAGEINVFAIALGEANLEVLRAFTHQFPPVRLKDLRFQELMVWVSMQAKAVTRSASHSGAKPNERVPLTTIKDWADLTGA